MLGTVHLVILMAVFGLYSVAIFSLGICFSHRFRIEIVEVEDEEEKDKRGNTELESS